MLTSYKKPSTNEKRDSRAFQAAADTIEDDLFDEAHPDPDSRRNEALLASEAQDKVQERLDQFFGKDENLSQEDLFLKKYIANKVPFSLGTWKSAMLPDNWASACKTAQRMMDKYT